MKPIINDKGEPVFNLGSGLAQTKLLYPATIERIKLSIKQNGVMKAIEELKKFKLSADLKKEILFIASGFMLTRQFKWSIIRYGTGKDNHCSE